jgi:hypothetical protein
VRHPNSQTRRRLAGYFYFGCLAPLVFAYLLARIAIHALRRLAFP